MGNCFYSINAISRKMESILQKFEFVCLRVSVEHCKSLIEVATLQHFVDKNLII